jgi:hypothetical protein
MSSIPCMTRDQKAAFDAGFSAHDSRIPRECNPHKNADLSLSRYWKFGYETAWSTRLGPAAPVLSHLQDY